MNNSYSKLRRRNTSLMKLRKGEVKFSIKKPKENNDEFSNLLYNEYINKKKLGSQNVISKRSVDILSSHHLKIYNENKNGESEKKSLFEKHMDNDIKEKNNNLLVNSTKHKLSNKNKNELIHDDDNNNLNKNNNNTGSDIEDINNKTNSFFFFIKKVLNNNKKDKKNNLFLKNFKKKKGKYNLNNDKEEDEEEDYGQILNIKVFYEGKGLSFKVSKEDKFAHCLSIIQKMLFPFYKLSDYDILYKLKVLDTKSLHDEKIKNIIQEHDNCVTFYLKKKIKNIITNSKDTTVLIENFPSFTDLATELNKFFEKEKRESNFTVDYKGTVCKVSFSESEKAFSLIIYLSKLKKVNPIYKRLKINMDYKLNVVLDTKKLRKEPVKLILPYISNNPKDNIRPIKNKSLQNKKKLAIKTENYLHNNNYNINKSRNKNIYNYDILQTKPKKKNESYENKINNYNISQTKPKKKYESFNYNINNYNTIQTKPKRYESSVSIGQNSIFNSQAKLFNNQLKSDNFLENSLIHSNENIWGHNYENKNLISPVNNHVKTIYNSDLNEGDPDKIINKISKVKSTNFIINLNKNKKKKGIKISLFNKNSNNHKNDDDDDDDRSFSSKDN